MTDFPSKAAIQKLITSHPDGVKGEPMAIGWSTNHPGTLVIIDSVGHKLIFPDAKPIPPNEPQPRTQKAPNKPKTGGSKTPNKQGEKQLRSTSKEEPGRPETTNKPKQAKP